MVGEEYGWVPLDGFAITLLILAALIVVMIPGFLLTLALFPKRNAMPMSERLALAFGLGLAPPFALNLLNVLLDVRVNLVTSLLAFLFVCAIGILGFLYKGGDLNLIKWYKSGE